MTGPSRTHPLPRAVPAIGILAVLSLAGCLADAPAAVVPMVAASSFTVEGLVQNFDQLPVPNATVTVEALGLETTTDKAGAFVLAALPRAPLVIHAAAPGYDTAVLAVAPFENDTTVYVRMLLPDVPSPEPYMEAISFNGIIACGAEYVIISGSCQAPAAAGNDMLVGPTGQRPLPEPLESEDTFVVELGENWQTLVVDVAFDGSTNPGMDGLRLIAQSAGSSNVTEDTKYATAHSAQSFTMRLDRGASYDTAARNATVPDRATEIALRVFAHSHAYHAVCTPEAVGEVQCFLGLGAAVDVRFKVVASTFYNEPAPAGWTAQA